MDLLLLSCYVLPPLRYCALHSYSILYVASWNAHPGILCWARQPIAMSVHGTSRLCRQLVAKLSGITKWYKSGTTKSEPICSRFYGPKTVCETNRRKWYYGRVCVLLKFQFACKSRLWNVANSTSYYTKTHHFGMKFSKFFSGEGHSPLPRPLPRWGGGHPLPPTAPRYSAPRYLALALSIPTLIFLQINHCWCT